MSKRSRKSSRKSASRHSAKTVRAATAGQSPGFSFSDRDIGIFSLAALFLVAWIAYANALHGSLVFDDATFAAGNHSWDFNYSRVADYFTSDVWASAGKQTGLYRPLFLTAVAAEIQVFGHWYTGYHLVNVLAHSLVTLALFSLIRYLMLASGCVPRLAGYAALLTALVFAVHPVNTEVVNSIFNRSGMLVALGVTAGLSWFLPRVKNSPVKSWIGINLIFLLILFCKETAVMFPPIIVAALLFDTPGNWRARLLKCVPVLSMLLPLGLFFAMRSMALGPAGGPGAVEQAITDVTAQQNGNAILSRIHLGFSFEKFVPAIKVWFDAMVHIVWPHPLFAFHQRSSTSLWLAVLGQASLLALALVALLRKYPGPLLGLAIYYLAILPSSRIFTATTVSSVLAERFLYLPSIGLAVSLAFLLYWLMLRFTVRSIALVVLVPALILTPLTWARNAQWSSTLSVLQSDYANGNRGTKLLGVLVATLIAEGEHARARQLCDNHPDVFAKNWFMSAACGQVYQKFGMDAKAEKAYLITLDSSRGKASGHYSLASLYLKQQRRVEAEEQFKQAIAAEKQPFMREILAAEMLMELYPNEPARLREARKHLKTAIALQPQVLFAQHKLAELDRMLDKQNED